ncbi:zinc metalloprotease chloroplastic-like [Raphidocelis subcapitata]|uniref:Zinc metalloprotease chloroplastic-like n=1 Tax=Raphidocelis subcapitata TaxID=307507 RepID=A0A2V0P941_9CHLO|nr:zinc metalloprotease chloroplastic-like [Raphidocelis subcapitata]|eukprot:GBF95462.1 zinc metalloprotease chloroplastic-like [Raphidocelis subcapitata]
MQLQRGQAFGPVARGVGARRTGLRLPRGPLSVVGDCCSSSTTARAAAPAGRRARTIACRSTSDDGQNARIKSTLADLDALLGIQEEAKPSEKETAADAAAAAASPLSPEALQSAVAEEMQKLVAREGITSPELEGVVTEQMKKILDRAKMLADEQTKEGASGVAADGQKQALRQDFENLLNIFFSGESGVDKADMQRLRESGVFGPLSFWVTEMRNLQEPSELSQGGRQVGYLVRGNLRKPRLEVFDALCAKVAELFGDKYEVLMIEDPEAVDPEDAPLPRPQTPSSSGAESSSGRGAAAAPEDAVRVAFQIVPAAAAVPPQGSGWKVAVAGVLLLFFLASCVQLSLVANITKLPKETLEYFANPDNINNDVLPPGLDTWDPAPYLACAAPIFTSLLGVNFLHEVGHRIAASVRGVKLGPTFFIPNLQIGSFGAITPIASLLKGRRDLWDVAAAGPIAGGLASIALLFIGLQQSHSGGLPQELLVPVPTQLFQGSLLLGSAARFALGEAAMSRTEVLISPLVIAGWCGLVTTSLNLLPVGNLDGGRMMQAAFGSQALSLSSFFVYVGLGLGLLGSSLSLPFGLYVLICQRNAEKYVKDSVTGVATPKQIATAAAVLTAILILVPLAPEFAQQMGVGPTNNMFM